MKTIKNICSDHKTIVLFYIGGVVSLILFGLYVYFFWPTFDADISGIIRQDRGQYFSALMKFIDWWGTSHRMIGSVLCASFLFFVFSYKREALFTLSVFVADIINIVLKLMINRPRPPNEVIYEEFQKASFPSGHGVHYAVLFGFILAVMLVNSRINSILRWAISLLCIFLIAGVPVALIYLNKHWATDVLAAYIFGFTVLGVVILWYLKAAPSEYQARKVVL